MNARKTTPNNRRDCERVRETRAHTLPLTHKYFPCWFCCLVFSVRLLMFAPENREKQQQQPQRNAHSMDIWLYHITTIKSCNIFQLYKNGPRTHLQYRLYPYTSLCVIFDLLYLASV